MDAIRFLNGRMKVWCRSRVRWERENLYLLPSGDFTDDQGRLHRREDNTVYVTLEGCDFCHPDGGRKVPFR